MRGDREDALVLEQDVPRVGPEEAGSRLERGRLADPVGAEDGRDPVTPGDDVEALENVEVAVVADVEVPHLEDRVIDGNGFRFHRSLLSRAPAAAGGGVGCDEKNSAWSRRGDCTQHTVIGRNSRRRNGLEPSRRLSETTEPRSPSASRVVFPTIEVTKRGAPRNRRRRSTHTAHRRWRRRSRQFTRCRRAPGARSLVPDPQNGRRTCSRSAASTSVVPMCGRTCGER